jgi:hypothetical protein
VLERVVDVVHHPSERMRDGTEHKNEQGEEHGVDVVQDDHAGKLGILKIVDDDVTAEVTAEDA